MGKNLQEQEKPSLEELGVSPADSCMEGIRSSEYVFTLHDSRNYPVALVGLAKHPVEETTGVVWSMTTDVVAQTPLAFVHALKELMEDYGGLYDRLVSFALSDNPKHQRFHATLGMTPTGERIPLEGTDLSYIVFEQLTTKGLNKLYYEQH